MVSREPLRRTVLVQPSGNEIDILEERSDELKKLCANGQQRKWPPLKKLGSEGFFQFGDLTADRRLLNPVGNVAHRGCDAAVFSDEIEQLKVMNVHDRKR